MSVQQTSLLAYAQIQGKLTERQAMLLEIIEEHGPINSRMLAEYAHLPVNCITAPVLELRRKGHVDQYVDEHGHKVFADPVTGHMTRLWRAIP